MEASRRVELSVVTKLDLAHRTPRGRSTLCPIRFRNLIACRAHRKVELERYVCVYVVMRRMLATGRLLRTPLSRCERANEIFAKALSPRHFLSAAAATSG